MSEVKVNEKGELVHYGTILVGITHYYWEGETMYMFIDDLPL